jgi:hypothetical protein
MNTYFAERFQDIADALPSASDDTLVDIQCEMERLLDEIRGRMKDNSNGSKPVAVAPAKVHSISTVGS